MFFNEIDWGCLQKKKIVLTCFGKPRWCNVILVLKTVQIVFMQEMVDKPWA